MGIRLSLPLGKFVPTFLKVLRDNSDSDSWFSDNENTTAEGESDSETASDCKKQSLIKFSSEKASPKGKKLQAVSYTVCGNRTKYTKEAKGVIEYSSPVQNVELPSKTLTVPQSQDEVKEEKMDINQSLTELSACQKNVVHPCFDSKCSSSCIIDKSLSRQVSETVLQFKTWNASDGKNLAALSPVTDKQNLDFSNAFDTLVWKDRQENDKFSAISTSLSHIKVDEILEHNHKDESQMVTTLPSCTATPFQTHSSVSTESVLSVSQVLGFEHTLNDADFSDDEFTQLVGFPHRHDDGGSGGPVKNDDEFPQQERVDKKHPVKGRTHLIRSINSMVDGDLNKPNAPEDSEESEIMNCEDESNQPLNDSVAIAGTAFFVCFGGITSHPSLQKRSTAWKVLSFDGNVWLTCGSLPEPRYDAAACMMDTTLYVSGGCNPLDPGGMAFASTWSLSPVKNAWNRLADMKQPRRLHALVHLDRKLYAIGGQSGDTLLNSVEYYDLKKRVWEEGPFMTVARAGAGVTTIKSQIWVCGGICELKDGLVNKLTKEIEVFDVYTQKWTFEKQLNKPRAFGELLNISDQLFLIGGIECNPRHGLQIASSILTHCSKTGLWRRWLSLRRRRFRSKAIFQEPHLYVIGGEKNFGGPAISVVECLNVRSGKWSQCCSMPYSLTGFCCCLNAPKS